MSLFRQQVKVNCHTERNVKSSMIKTPAK